MAKFSFQKIGKDAGKVGVELLMLTGGVVVSRKFINLEKFAQLPEFLRNYQGLVKFLLGIILAQIMGSRNATFKLFFYGISLDGLIVTLRKFMGEGMLPLGEQPMDISRQITEGVAEQPSDITQQITEGVAAGEDMDGEMGYEYSDAVYNSN